MTFPRAQGGWNPAALWAILIGVLPTLPGFLSTIGVLSGLPPIFGQLYDLAWFVGVAVSSVVYWWVRWGGGERVGRVWVPGDAEELAGGVGREVQGGGAGRWGSGVTGGSE